jgi:hypothetical protein
MEVNMLDTCTAPIPKQTEVQEQIDLLERRLNTLYEKTDMLINRLNPVLRSPKLTCQEEDCEQNELVQVANYIRNNITAIEKITYMVEDATDRLEV